MIVDMANNRITPERQEYMRNYMRQRRAKHKVVVPDTIPEDIALTTEDITKIMEALAKIAKLQISNQAMLNRLLPPPPTPII